MSSQTGDIPLTLMDHHDPCLLEELMSAVGRVAGSGAFTGGAAVEEFEADWASWCEAKHAVGVASGTEALTLTLRALELGPGDDVIVPANSFIATAEAVSLIGARPRFADVDPNTQLVTAQTLRAALTPATRCLIPVHLYGRTVDMDPVLELARLCGVLVVEDAAQAHGARYRGKRVGTLGDAGTFSFYPAKNLGAWGDGGAVITSSGALAERLRLLRSHGESPRYHHRIVGTTGRLDAVQAAVLQVKLRRLEAGNEARRAAARRLREALSGIESLMAPATVPEGEDHVYHQFVIRTAGRDQLRDRLAAAGIATGIHYPVPIHRSQAYAADRAEDDVAPNCSRQAKEVLSLPIFPAITDAQIERIAATLERCMVPSPDPIPALSS